MEPLRILVIGNGGREHALVWKLSQSPRVEHIFVLPGNGGTATLSKVTNVTSIKADDYPEIISFARKENINLAVPGPEAPLVDGIEGYFRAAAIRCFGPSKAAARMEGSKTFSKDFMQRHNIPTAAYRNFNDYQSARDYLDSVQHDVVLKASGLAAGKGVIIPANKEEAHSALRDIMLKREFGPAGNEVVIEEYLAGDELSILTFSDGSNVKSLPPAQDHKRIYDGDRGPNTGGMGCYAPTKVASRSLLDQIEKEIIKPTIDGMRKEGFPFRGVLFTGLMITGSGPKVLEYNVRFGDPETQTLLPLLSEETDLAIIMLACTYNFLGMIDIQLREEFAATVVVAAGGYPGPYAKGTDIQLSPPPKDVTIFHAGTVSSESGLKTSGGRVIAATATARTLEEAVSKAYEGVQCIQFDGMQYRKDIAHRAFEKPAPAAGSLTYADAGVSIDAGNSLVEQIRTAVKSTKRSGTDSEIGGFGGIFNLQAAGFESAPTLVGAIDGVGTKLHVAQAVGKHDTVGVDLVAMNVNDLVVQGAEPLFFLDCYSCGKLDVNQAASFVQGVAKGCREAGCALIGGETAEMPGLYSGGDFNVVGAAVGAIRGSKILPDTSSMTEGDVLLGLPSNGIHSNGFSLVRAIIKREGIAYDAPAPWDERSTVGQSLLTPTRIYVKPLLALVEKSLVLGMSHITGGGLTENVPRMLPQELAAEIDISTWPLPPVFAWLKKAGMIESSEFARTFNCGIGMVLVVSKDQVDAAIAELEQQGEKVVRIGRLIKRTEAECILQRLESWS
ncbi:MAG: hypothetical protein M1823_003462 [Watsoniomyces obsoletus]|nr:MAG: hypothetical protein M1823_003462 [Watsoniomyces obsoletus]